MKDVTLRWVMRAETHLGGAQVLLKDGYFEQAVFWTQQALEVLLKAMLVERSTVGIARRTHDLPSLAEELSLNLTLDQFDFLRDLSDQYASTRYPEEFVEYTQDLAGGLLGQATELFEWLRQQLT